MSEPFIAEIRIFAGNCAPRGWAFCNGQLLPIAQNTALFSLIGTTYGGDGRTTTALPNLQGRAPMHPGHGPGLSVRRLGERGGDETAALSEAQMPNHTHSANVTPQSGDQGDPSPGAYLAGGSTPATTVYGDGSATLDGALAPGALPLAGGGQPHNNLQPFLTMNFIIALVGLFPSRGGAQETGTSELDAAKLEDDQDTGQVEVNDQAAEAVAAAPKTPRKPGRKVTVKKPARRATVKKPARKATVKRPARKATVKKPARKATVKKPVRKAVRRR